MLETENMIDLLGLLKEMPSEHLSQLIQEETAKEAPNDQLVLTALDILEDRKNESPIELGPKGKAAWKKYQSKVRSRQRKTVLVWKPLIQVASVLLVITILFAWLPTQANAETWWARLARWTDDFFSFFNPNTSEVPEDEYFFQTDNEGLQQVYETVIAMEIAEPIIPMWIPDTYVLEEIIVDNIPDQSVLVASFNDGTDNLVIQICVLNSEVNHFYHKTIEDARTYEKYGTTYNIIDNVENKVILWTNKNIECALSIDCQDDILYEIIDSIYRWRSK